ncbi:cellulose synthase subunit [Palleronia pelagia]|uniref:Cyclic di-GMP-binding protein n=2 Tax=Palleronia pelagia TaxID=387096 RepID=A0A1H8HCM0_9RHOB|nr:cellulose synthase subunit [Palleronia pelagia]
MIVARSALCACLAIPIAAYGQSNAVNIGNGAESSAKETISRSISLIDLGLTSGLTFESLSGSATIFVPIPNELAVIDGVITLELTHGATVPAERYLQVSVAGRAAQSHSITGKPERFQITIEFDSSAVSNGFLAIELNYSGAFTDQVCVDDRASGDFVEIAPTSSVSLTLSSSAFNSPAIFAGFRPPIMRIALPEQTAPAALAAAARAAALFDAESGALRLATANELAGQDQADEESPQPVWRVGEIRIEIDESGFQSEMLVGNDGEFPSLLIRGADPQVGLWQLASSWAQLANKSNAVTTDILERPQNPDRLPFSLLSADLTPRSVVSMENVLIPFKSSDLPAHKTVSSIDLITVAALDSDNQGATVSVFLNETLLGSRPLNSGNPERMNFAVPGGLLSRDNQLRVLIQRQASGGECRYRPQGYPAQILPGSAIILQDDDSPVENFFVLRRDFGDGVQFVLDNDLGFSLRDAFPWISTVVASMIPDRATIITRSSVSELQPDLPFLVISKENPADHEPAITFDKGRIEIVDQEGGVMFAGENLESLAFAQIVSRDGQRGLWLRPGSGSAPEPSEASPFILDRGDLALMDQEGLIVATSTRNAPLIEVSYPDRVSIVQLITKYRLWLVGVAWALLTLTVLVGFQRFYRNRRSQAEKSG